MGKIRHNLTGQKFGTLTCIERRKGKWIARCECGNEKAAKTNVFISGRLKSCGCKRAMIKSLSARWTGYEEISGSIWKHIQHDAKRRKLAFEISIEYAYEIYLKQDKKCILTGLDLQFQTKGKVHDGTASLDRIDSKKGYIEGNIQWLHKDINRMKWNLPLDSFRKYCRLVAQHENRPF